MSEDDTDLDERGARDAFALHVDLIGTETAARALDALEAGLRSVLIEGQPSDNELGGLAGEAHALISTATVAGFLAVARTCRDFEDCCEAGAARAAFERAREVAVAALAEIGRLRRELQTGSGVAGECGRLSGRRERLAS